MHFTTQAVEVMSKDKKNNKTPNTMAPITLVAANPTPKSMREVSVAPRAPIIKAPRAEPRQRPAEHSQAVKEVARAMAKNPMDIPRATQ